MAQSYAEYARDRAPCRRCGYVHGFACAPAGWSGRPAVKCSVPFGAWELPEIARLKMALRDAVRVRNDTAAAQCRRRCHTPVVLSTTLPKTHARPLDVREPVEDAPVSVSRLLRPAPLTRRHAARPVGVRNWRRV